MIDPQEIESYVEDSMHFGMTHEQIKNFVVNQHVTSARQLRQVLTLSLIHISEPTRPY